MDSSDDSGIDPGIEEEEFPDDLPDDEADDEGTGDAESRDEVDVAADVVGEAGMAWVFPVFPMRVIFSVISMSLVASWNSSLSKKLGLYAFVAYF